MLTLSKPESAAAGAVSNPSDLRIGELLAALDAHRDKPLVFSYQDRPVKSGYHVTEVKAANFSALDCGANPEAWAEIFIQLWDVDEGGREHMPAGKFSAKGRSLRSSSRCRGAPARLKPLCKRHR